MIEVLPLFTKVKLSGPDYIDAYIVGIQIRKGNIQYECEWWDGRSVKSYWFYADSITTDGPAVMEQIGFITP